MGQVSPRAGGPQLDGRLLRVPVPSSHPRAVAPSPPRSWALRRASEDSVHVRGGEALAAGGQADVSRCCLHKVPWDAGTWAQPAAGHSEPSRAGRERLATVSRPAATSRLASDGRPPPQPSHFSLQASRTRPAARQRPRASHFVDCPNVCACTCTRPSARDGAVAPWVVLALSGVLHAASRCARSSLQPGLGAREQLCRPFMLPRGVTLGSHWEPHVNAYMASQAVNR